eukprot:TRINITY_DN10410_c0_g1_i1.p1 TRINITY_DN10410_c0_g1~~TRINITY_DN10410_c0_g1_i1.p1  ORF type:complete len:309 (-),score=65.65 TRINITY_DN10410_c0_g1_i1:455-1339(-)
MDGIASGLCRRSLRCLLLAVVLLVIICACVSGEEGKLVVDHYRPIFEIKRKTHDEIVSGVLGLQKASMRLAVLDTILDEMFDTLCTRMQEIVEFSPGEDSDTNMWSALPLDASGGVWEITALLSDLVVATKPEEAATLISRNDTRMALLQTAAVFARTSGFYDRKHQGLLLDMAAEVNLLREIPPLPQEEEESVQPSGKKEPEHAEGMEGGKSREEIEAEIVAELAARSRSKPGDAFRSLEKKEILAGVAERISVSRFSDGDGGKKAKTKRKWAKKGKKEQARAPGGTTKRTEL